MVESAGWPYQFQVIRLKSAYMLVNSLIKIKYNNMTYFSFPGLKKIMVKEFIVKEHPDKVNSLANRLSRFVMIMERITGYKMKDLKRNDKRGQISVLRAIFAEYMYSAGLVTYAEIAAWLNQDYSSICYYFKTLLPSIKATDSTKALYDKFYHYL